MNSGNQRFSMLLATAVAIAVLFMGWMEASVACKGMPATWPPGNRCLFVKFFYDWQQLLGGMFALVAAAIGWLAIKRQVEVADIQEKERFRQRHDSARSMLPLALSDIAGYAIESVRELKKVYAHREGELILPQIRWVPPFVPDSATARLREMVEASGPDHGKPIARLLWRIQIQASRLRSLSSDLTLGVEGRSVLAANVEQYFVDAVEIYALASGAFPFARGKQENLSNDEPTLEMMFNGVMGTDLMDDEFEAVRERINRQYGNVIEEG